VLDDTDRCSNLANSYAAVGQRRDDDFFTTGARFAVPAHEVVTLRREHWLSVAVAGIERFDARFASSTLQTRESRTPTHQDEVLGYGQILPRKG
jgi:hypothetical protein